MTYLTTDEVIRLQALIIEQTGGSTGILDRGRIDSAVAQPQAAFGGHDLYPSLSENAPVMGFSLARNHGFVDGNKRIAHAAMETFLVLNGSELDAGVDEQEDVFLRLAAGALARDEFFNWVGSRIRPIPTTPAGP